MTNLPISTWHVTPTRAIHADRPCFLGILNRTPDSFSDGGELDALASVVQRARELIAEGASILDMGGESTRPGARRIDVNEQIDRVVPAIRAIRDAGIDIPISVDTTRTHVADAALDAGADAINDVSAGTEDASILDLASERGCGIILMHRLAPPGDDRYSDQYQEPPVYVDVMRVVADHLASQADRAIACGVHPSRILLDPGLGFGKSVDQNLELIRRTGELVDLGYPILSAASRKSFAGRISLGRDSDPHDRLEGSLACSIAHLHTGARFFRVHDVGAQKRALDAAWRIMGSESEARD